VDIILILRVMGNAIQFLAIHVMEQIAQPFKLVDRVNNMDIQMEHAFQIKHARQKLVMQVA
jgi:hypothetical protein